MAGTNEIKLFAGPSTNTLTPSAWAALTSLLANGFSPGLASSQQANTLFRQISTAAAGVGEFIAGQGFSALDNGNISDFATALQNAIGGYIATSGLVVPSGSIIDFGAETPPTGWLECNGASLLRAGAYANLFAVIGTAHGAVDGTHFNLPDHRGRFKRGWDDTANNDPDHASRTAMATGGATGNHVGTLEDDAIRNIVGVISQVIGGYAGSSGALYSTSGASTAISAGTVAATALLAFDASRVVPVGTDNRPVNAAVMSIIKI